MQRIMFIPLIAIVIQACAGPKPAPVVALTATPAAAAAATQTPKPTQLALPPTATPDALKALLPKKAADKAWQGIPVMPGALQGEGDDLGYTFTIDATARQVSNFYVFELGARGWLYYPYAQGDTGSDLMLFQRGQETLIISVHEGEGGEVVVVMVK
jgi:hypothetical protein